MDKLKIRMIGKLDSDKNEYFFTTCRVPILVDLSNSVIHFFPDTDASDDSKFGGELVIRHYDKRTTQQSTASPEEEVSEVIRRRRNHKDHDEE